MSEQHSGHHHHQAQGGPSALMVELSEHVPFSVSAVAIGLALAGAICILSSGGSRPADTSAVDPAELFFHLFHPAHMFFSAAATAAMFHRYEKKPLKALVVGMIGAVGVCGISDIAMPHASLAILGVKTSWHICAWEHPWLAFPFAVVGVMVGVAAAGSVVKSTLISHSLHVFASTMASIFYMVGPLGMLAWIEDIGKVFIFVVLAVVVPCCLSDIVFPVMMSSAGRAKHNAEPHSH